MRRNRRHGVGGVFVSRAARLAWLILIVVSGAAACSAAPASLGPATWELDPAFESPSEDASELNILVWEVACSSGSSIAGRVSELQIDYAPDSITVTIRVRQLEDGLQSCPRPPGMPMVVQLAGPIGGRSLIDGGRQPPAVVHPIVEPTVAPLPTGLAPADLAGTAWTADTVAGQPVAGEAAPTVEFDWLGRESGHGFTGCDEFGFAVTFKDEQLSIGDFILNPSGCGGPGAAGEEAFLATLREVEEWSVDGDELTLSGPEGEIVLRRDLPPVGDPGRELAETMLDGEWRVVRADNVENLEILASFDFADAILIAVGECGLSSDVHFGPGGAIDIVEVGWDTIGGACPVDPRPGLKSILDAVTSGSVEPDGTVVLSGPEGDVVFAR